MEHQADWIKNWGEILDAAVSAVLFYFLIVAMVRIFGKRSTAQLNNFDWIINITVGSLAASGILLTSVPALRAAVAILTIMVLQFMLTWLTIRSRRVARLVKVSPTLLFHKGEYLHDAMRRSRISEEEVCSALREHGVARKDANWVILETDGQMTVIPKQDVTLAEADTMGNVERPPQLR